MQQRSNDRTVRVRQKRNSQFSAQIRKETEVSDVLMEDHSLLENITCKIGDSACAAKHVSVIQRTGILHPMGTSQRVKSLTNLQRQYGNRFVQKVIAQHAIQSKLKIGQPGDIYEKEADRLAEQVMKMPKAQRQEDEEEEPVQTKSLAEQITPFAQRQKVEEEEEQGSLQTRLVDSDLVQRQEELEEEKEEQIQTKQTRRNTSQLSSRLETQIQSLEGSGEPLPESDRAFFEPRFGYDFGQVRVHTDSQAAEISRMLKAQAFTVGRNVVFGAGKYSPETTAGRELLAHELAHVVQQRAGTLTFPQRWIQAKKTIAITRDIHITKRNSCRRNQNSSCTLGRATINGHDVGYTLELPDCGNRKSVSRIPRDTYRTTEDPSHRKYGYCLRLHNVRGRSGILIHVGNWPRDTTGCILPGQRRQTRSCVVSNSRRALRDYRRIINGDPDIETVVR